jgi:hypothetical protein
MEETPTSPIREVLPNGYFEVKGKATTDRPLRHSKVPDELIFFRHVQREEWDTIDRNGNNIHCEEILNVESEFAAFSIQDETGAIHVNPRGARLEGKLLTRDVADRLGGVSLGVVAGVGLAHGGGATRGGRRNYKVVHEIFGAPNGADLYVLGTTVPGPSEPAMFQHRTAEERPYVISARSEEELTERVGEGSIIRHMIAITFFLVALTCLALIQFLPREYLDFNFEEDAPQTPQSSTLQL